MSLVEDVLGLDYHHPSGEVHIMANNQWVSCPGKHSIPETKKRGGASKLLEIILLILFYYTGQDNPSIMCSVGDVPDIFLDGNTTDHGGPFDGVMMGEGCRKIPTIP